MKKSRIHLSEAAFSRIEFVVVLATLALLAGVTMPALANSKSRSQRVTCLANLQQIGRAIHLWGNDHGNKVPWQTDVSEGGTFSAASSLKNQAWWQFAWMSNELVTPRILVCPADNIHGSPRV